MKYLSGIRPSGKLHLGNYIGAILPAIKYSADILIARYHEPEGDYLALAKEVINYTDKIIFQEINNDLYFKLLKLSQVALLSRIPQYKTKDKNASMLTYPVLMAHDLVGYDYVIVGDDQKPHIEFAKYILSKAGYKCPKPIYEGGRVMDLRNTEQKMSKSNPSSCLFLSDTKEEKERKIMKAITDEKGRKNLEFICKNLGGEIPESNKDLKINIIKKLNNI